MNEITNENFNEHFRDARASRPKEGEILATFTAIADFVGGKAKQDIIYLLKINKAKEAAQVMNRIHGAKAPWCYRVPRLMAEDLLAKSEKEVEDKPYEMVVEFPFWTKREYVPKSDPHWTTLNVMEFDPDTGEYKVKIQI